jgi:hypothetical protein
VGISSPAARCPYRARQGDRAAPLTGQVHLPFDHLAVGEGHGNVRFAQRQADGLRPHHVPQADHERLAQALDLGDEVFRPRRLEHVVGDSELQQLLHHLAAALVREHHHREVA